MDIGRSQPDCAKADRGWEWKPFRFVALARNGLGRSPIFLNLGVTAGEERKRPRQVGGGWFLLNTEGGSLHVRKKWVGGAQCGQEGMYMGGEGKLAIFVGGAETRTK